MCPDQKAIKVSSFSESKRVNKYRKMGAGVYIKKPYQMDKIGLTIKQELYNTPK